MDFGGDFSVLFVPFVPFVVLVSPPDDDDDQEASLDHQRQNHK